MTAKKAQEEQEAVQNSMAANQVRGHRSKRQPKTEEGIANFDQALTKSPSFHLDSDRFQSKNMQPKT